MSAYANVVGGKLKLKGKPLDVRAAGVKKKKKKRDAQQEQLRLLEGLDEEKGVVEGEQTNKHSPSEADAEAKGEVEVEGEEGRAVERPGAPCEDQRTAAEKRYHEQKAQLDAQRMSKVACKSHRQRVEEFNQYLANLSEHYDIPKVGPG